MAEKAYIVEAVRTAGGKRDGKLSLWHPADLGAKVLDEITSRLDHIFDDTYWPSGLLFEFPCQIVQSFTLLVPVHGQRGIFQQVMRKGEATRS